MGTQKKKLGSYVKNAAVRWKPPTGWRGMVRVISASCKINAKDHPRWTLNLEAKEGEDKGKKFSISLGFSDSDIGNGITLEQFQMLGINPEDLDEMDSDQLCSAVEGLEGIVVAGYRADKDDPTKEWDNHRFVAGAVEDKPKRPRRSRKAAAEETEEEEEAPKPKRRSRKKPEPEPEPETDDDEEDWDEEED